MTRTLVADDDPQIRRLLARLLTSSGHDCAQADSVSTARELLSESVFDLAIVDMRMAGDTDGLDLLREIGGRHSETATVMLTGVEDPQLAAAAYKLGADGYVIKPFRPSQLLITVANALERRQLEADNARHRREVTRVLAAEQQARERAVRAVHRARALARISDELLATRDPAGLRDVVAQTLTNALGDGCAVLCAGDPGAPGEGAGQFRLASIRHRVPQVREAVETATEASSEFEPFLREVWDRLRAGNPIVSAEVDPDAALAAGLPPPLADVLRRWPVSSLVCQPVRLDDEVVALIAVIRHSPHEAFAGEDVMFLGEVAERLSLAADNARLHALSQESLAALQHHALHDPLTNLPNRVLFLDLVRQSIAGLERRSGVVALLFLDLDGFKTVNDSLGHAAGDQLLVAVTRRLAGFVRGGDVFARLGGDEFAIGLPQLADVAAAAHMAQRVLRGLAEPFTVEGHEIVTSASIGITVTSDPHARPEDLLREADTAMHRAKAGGRARLEVFGEAMREKVTRRLRDETALRRALDSGQMRVHYQPILDLATRVLVGTEALVRWQHPERGLLDAGAFIDLAEETRLVVPLGNWVLGEACRQLARWRTQPHLAGLALHVNVSPQQFTQPDFVDMVAGVLTETAVPPNSVALEITETTIMDHVHAALPILHGLRNLGVGLYVDDFGTGYSSLNYLRRLPIDGMKIDKSFVDGLGTEADALGIVLTVIDLARRLHLNVVAEGVENDRQHTMLMSLGCRHAQGFRFAKALPAEAVPPMVEAALQRANR